MPIKRGTVAEFEALGFPKKTFVIGMSPRTARSKTPTPPGTDGPKTRRGGLIYLGSVPDTDPRYQSGWNFLSGKNLSQLSGKASTEPSSPTKPSVPPVDEPQKK
jgi:hypothetical protein